MIKLPKRQHLSRQQQQRSKRQSTVNSDADSDNDTASDGSIDWQVTQLNWQRCESIWLTWAGGHGPFNLNATWWPDGQSNDANSGMVAYLVGNHNYQWVARTPPNTTFKFDVVDTSNGQRISSPLEIHVGSGYAQGLSTCPLDTPASSSFAYQYAVTSSSSSFPAAVQATATSSFASTSAYVYPSSNSTTADPSLQSSNADSSSSSSPQKDVKGLKAGIALLCLALIALAFMYYRLRKQMQRLQKGQSTVGRWMNHHVDANGHGGRLGGIIGGRQRQDSYQRMEDTDQDSAPNMKTKDNERSSFAMSETSDLSSRMSSFFDHRSASRSGSRASATRPTINPFIDTTSVSSPSVVDKALSEEDEEDEAFRSASQQRRHSETSSELSDVTVTSGGGSRLSSVTHSDLASNVGNASVVSDDHYHRAKASTISPTALGPARTAMAQYLDPRFALLDSKR